MNLPSACCALSHPKEDGPGAPVAMEPGSHPAEFEAFPLGCVQIGCVPVMEGQGEQRQGEPGLCKR